MPRQDGRGANRPSEERAGPTTGAQPRVVLWPDTFSQHFLPGALAAAVEVLEHAGLEVVLPAKSLCCGRPLYDSGMIDKAKRLWVDVLDTLEPEIDAGTPVVGIEPSCVVAFRDELPHLFPDDPRAERLSKLTCSFAELLLKRVDDYRPPRLEGRAIVQAHCQHQAVVGFDCDRELLEAMGLEVTVLDSGCCGMAGAFGFERDKYAVSVAVGERALLPAVRRAAQETFIVADGFSCREQVAQLSSRTALHSAEVLQLALHRAALAERASPEEAHAALRAPELAPAALRLPSVARAGALVLGAFAFGSFVRGLR